MLITADHGNADQMLDPENGETFTAHSTNPVPFIVCGKDVELRDGEYQVVKAPRKEKPITLIRRAVETTKKSLSNPAKLFKDLFSYKIEDEDIDLTC